MASIFAVRSALASQIQSKCNITCKERMPDQINPPMAVLLPGAPYAKYGITLGESTFGLPLAEQVPVAAEVNLKIGVFVSRAPSLEQAQAMVDQWLGLEAPSAGIMSIPAAILSDPTLGGIVDFCEPLDVIAYGDEKVAGQDYFWGAIRVNISVTQDLGA